LIAYDELQLTRETTSDLSDFHKEIEAFREEGPLDPISLAKLEEHFRAAHVYNSAAIEGNRLTLQETMLVLKEGIDVRDKPLSESLEVRRLGEAFDFLRELAKQDENIREKDIRDLHSLLIGDQPEFDPGQYRRTGVIITGSEHRPPEPLDVPWMVTELVEWLRLNKDKNPLIVAAVAHHQLASIHPFKDGNGRVSRLLMNLVLMRSGYPICNIRSDLRPAYYEALSFADVGIYDPLARQIKDACASLFSEYLRIRNETKRATEWAAKWGKKEAQVHLRKETRELELWQSKIKQIFLEFQNNTELLNDKLDQIDVEFYDFKNEIDLDKYERLLQKGIIDRGNAFSISFSGQTEKGNISERFMFRYCRPQSFTPKNVITLELNHLDREDNRYVRIGDSACRSKVQLRYLYISANGALIKRYSPLGHNQERDASVESPSELVQGFLDEVLSNVIGLR
jgi:Fic family protein